VRAILRDSELLVGRADGATFRRENATESYVEVPPAYVITDSTGATWTLGAHYIQRGATFEFGVMRNDVYVGEMASKIVYRRGKIRIFGADGWRIWTGKFFV
jgi:hypothetical protein